VLIALILGAGCLAERSYRCESDAQCLAKADGVCGDENWCVYPDEGCASGIAYGPQAPPSIADTCVSVEAGSGGGSGMAGTASDSGEPTPQPSCGDGVVDPGETCDDGNRLPNDGCHPQCVEPGSPTWTVSWDGEANGEDRGFGVAVDAGADAVYVAGFTTVDGMDYDILVQRWALETGEHVWTRAVDGGALGQDMGEHVAVDGQGNVVVAGVVTTADRGTDAWLTKYSPDGDVLWTLTHDESGGDDKGAGVALLDGDVIVMAGHVEVDGRTDAWVQRYDTDGNAVGDAVRRGDEGFNEAIDVIAQGSEYQVTGSLTDPTDGQQAMWTARYSADGALLWEHVLTMSDNGNAARGVGQDFDPLGGSSVGGVIVNNLLVQRYGETGMPTTAITIDGPDSAHDEAADVAFSPDGTFVVVGFLDFRTTGFAESDTWLARYTAAGEEIWTDRFQGAAQEIDKALGVALTPDLSAVVVGYETVPGSARNMWLRRYAL